MFVCCLSFSKPIMPCLSLKAIPGQWPCWAFPSQFGIGLFQAHVGLCFSKPFCQVQPAFSKTRGPAVFSKTTEPWPPPGKHPQLSKRWGRPPWLPSSVRPGKHQCPRPHIPGRSANCHQKWQQHPTARQDLPSHPHHISSSRFLFTRPCWWMWSGIMASMSTRTCLFLVAVSTAESRITLQLFQACQVVLAHNIILFQGVVPVNHHHRLFQALGGTAMGGAALARFQILGLGLFQVLGRLALLFFAFLFQGGCWLFQARRRACSSSRGEHSLPWLATLAPVLGAPCPGLIRGGELFQFLGNSICHPLLAPCFCLFQGFQVLGQDSGVSWVCLFQGWPLHPLPPFLPGLGSGPMTSSPFCWGALQAGPSFPRLSSSGGFSNPLGFSKPSLRDQAFPNPKPCFSSRAFPSPPTATSYKWYFSCMCWLWSVVTKLCYSGCCFLADFCCWWACVCLCKLCAVLCKLCVCACSSSMCGDMVMHVTCSSMAADMHSTSTSMQLPCGPH